MLQCPINEQTRKQVGQRVSIKNKNGTLRFFGTTHFADGLWYGIELDEADGEHDGIVNNVQYFTCRKNHGIFIPESDLIFTDDGSLEMNLEISTVPKDFSSERLCKANCNVQNYKFNCTVAISDSEPVSPEILDQKNKSYTISKKAHVGQLSIIAEETLGSMILPKSTNVSFLDFENDLNKFKTLYNEKTSNSSDQFPEQKMSHQSFEEYDSDDSLGILPHILEDTHSCDNLDLEIYAKENLNATISLSNSSEKCFKYQNVAILDNELLTPPISLMSKCPFLLKREESLVCNNASTPKFASTPKHETNFSYVIDEEAVTSTENFLYDLEFPMNPLEIGKHSQFVLNKTTEMVLDSENISPVVSNACKSFTEKNRNPAQSILNATCIISDPIDTNQIPLHESFDHSKFVTDVGCAVKSHKDFVDKLSIQDNALPDYNNFIKHIMPKALGVAITCNSPENNENKNILNVTCSIPEPNEITNIIERLDIDNISKNMLNATISYSEIIENEKVEFLNTTISYSDVAKNKVINNKLESNIVVSDEVEILNTNVSYSELAKNKVLNNKTEILNTTISHSGIAESNVIVSNEVEILNTNLSYSEVIKNSTALNDKAEILNTTISYSKAAESNIVVNDKKEILNATFEKIEEPCDLDTNVKLLKSFKPAVNSNESKKIIQFDAKNKDARLNSAFKANSSHCEERSEKICSTSNRNKQFRKSVGCFVKSSVTNANFKNPTRRNSTSSSRSPSSKADQSAIHCFNKNLYDKNPVETKTVKKSFVYRKPLNNPNSNYNTCKTLSSSSCGKSNFTEDKHETKDSEVKLKNCCAFNKTKNISSLLPNVGKTVVKKPHCSTKNFAEDKREKVDSEVKLNDETFFETKNIALLPDVGKTIVKRPRHSLNFENKKDFSEPCKKLLFKPQTKIITSSKNNLLKIPTICEKELPAPKSNKHSMIPGLKKPSGFNVTPLEENNQRISRIPGKCVLAQKNIPANSTSVKANSTNLHKLHSFIPAMKINTKQSNSQTHPSKSTTICPPLPKSHLNDTMVIPNHQIKSKPTSQAIKLSYNKKIGQRSATNSQNRDPDFTQKACLNSTIILSDNPSNNEESNQNLKFCKSSSLLSRIPSVSQNNRKKI